MSIALLSNDDVVYIRANRGSMLNSSFLQQQQFKVRSWNEGGS